MIKAAASPRATPTRSTARCISPSRAIRDYGKLSGRRVEEQEAGRAWRVRDEKRHPADFALWKKAEPEHILRWPSPVGLGLSRLAHRMLGHGDQVSGRDVRHSRRRRRQHLPAQRVRDRAEPRRATTQPFAHYWLLTGSLTVDGVKMSKSLGNFITIKDALKKYQPEAIRFFMLQGLYRNPVDYSDAALEAASKGWERLNATARRVRNELKAATPELGKDNTPELNQNLAETLDKARMQFTSVMNDDFNTPLAIGALFDLSTEVNRWIDKGIATQAALQDADGIYREMGADVLGVIANAESKADSGSAAREAQLIELMIQMRNDARKAKDFARADGIRQRGVEDAVALLARASAPHSGAAARRPGRGRKAPRRR